MVATHLELLTQRVVLQQFEVNHARLLFFFTCSPELQALLMNQLTVKVRLQSLFFMDSSAHMAAHVFFPILVSTQFLLVINFF